MDTCVDKADKVMHPRLLSKPSKEDVQSVAEVLPGMFYCLHGMPWPWMQGRKTQNHDVGTRPDPPVVCPMGLVIHLYSILYRANHSYQLAVRVCVWVCDSH